jgi:hypothetical protein
MLVSLRLGPVDAVDDVENCVFSFMKLLEEQCQSISACDIVVECTSGDRIGAGECLVRLGLHVFGEVVDVAGRSPLTGNAPLQGALQSAYEKAMDALHSVARLHHSCPCHDSQATSHASATID